MRTLTRRPTPRSPLALAAMAVVAVAVATLTGCSKDREPAVGATTIRVQGIAVHAIDRPATGDETGLTVLFLHGQSYTSRIWDDRGILDDVAAAGHHAVAVDLPGYGETPEPKSLADGTSMDDARFVRALIAKLGGPAQVVVVSPSMSGRFSLAYLAGFPADRLAGYVPVAPVGSDTFARPWPDKTATAVPVPGLIIWGSKDDSFDRAEGVRLARQLRTPKASTLTEIPGASHACYDDHPDEFTRALLQFLGGLHP